MTTTALPTPPSMKSRVGRILGPSVAHALFFVCLPLALLVAWWVATNNSSSMFFPPLSEILSSLAPTWARGRLLTDALPSVGRLLLGYGMAIVVGVSLGVTIGLSPRLRAFMEPVLEFFRAIPPPVLVPVLMLLLGIGFTMKIFVIAFGACWPVLLNTIEGVRSIDDAQRDVARTYQFRRRTYLTALVLPGASPQIMAGARQALSIAIILMVISEMFAANNGLGFMIVQFQRSFAILEMWTGILLLGALGMVLSVVFRIVETRMLKWYDGLRQSERGN